MKQLTAFLTLLALMACNPNPVVVQQQAPPYQYIQSPTGQQMVVVQDNSGVQFLMEYAMFNSLMNSGGYGTVINYYHTYPTRCTRYNSSSYSGWRSFNGRSYSPSSYSGFRSSGGGSSPVFKNTTPSQSNGFRSSGTSSSPVFRNTSPSGSSGFRSSNTNSSGGFFKSSSSGFRSSSSGGFRSSSRRR